MKLTLVLDVPSLRRTREAHDYAVRLAEAIVELPLNDECSIHRITVTPHVAEERVS